MRIFNITHLGDLYRFYVESNGEVLRILRYDMGLTGADEIDEDQVPRCVLQELERQFANEHSTIPSHIERKPREVPPIWE